MSWPTAATLLAPLAPWFLQIRRDLPWRASNLHPLHPDPYAVLVSELMLQQTQVATVEPYFRRWMTQFPTPAALAEASEGQVLKAWEGLGYYRRARFLKAAATAVAEKGWPLDLVGLEALPGLGPYTAAAVGAIAFQWPTPALDGNAFRVLARLLLLEGDPRRRAAELREWLMPALEHHGPSLLTQALMELGATTCGVKAACERCPLALACGAHRTGRQAEIPPTLARTPPREIRLWLLALEAEDAFLLHEPRSRGLLAGLWRWPALEADLPLEPVKASLPLRSWPGWTQVYTHRREQVRPLHLQRSRRPAVAPGLRWVPREELATLPLGRRDQRLRELLLTEGEAPLTAPDPKALLQLLKKA